MSLALWNEPLSQEEREHLLLTVADMVAKRGLQTPALFALEIHRPLAFIASQGMLAFAPLMAPLIGLERLQQVSRLMAEPGAIDDLIARIEATEIRKEAH